MKLVLSTLALIFVILVVGSEAIIQLEHLSTLYLPFSYHPSPIYKYNKDVAEQSAYDPNKKILYTVGELNFFSVLHFSRNFGSHYLCVCVYVCVCLQLCLTLTVSKVVDSVWSILSENVRNVFKIVSIFWLIQLQVMVSSFKEHQRQISM